MRSEYKMMLAGFGAGAVIGLLALSSVNASVDAIHAYRGDRLAAPVKPPLAYGNVDPAAVVSHVELIGPKGTVVEFRDHAGKVVYRSDPVHNVTVVAKNAVIPSVTVLERPGDVADLKLVTTGDSATTTEKSD